MLGWRDGLRQAVRNLVMVTAALSGTPERLQAACTPEYSYNLSDGRYPWLPTPQAACDYFVRKIAIVDMGWESVPDCNGSYEQCNLPMKAVWQSAVSASAEGFHCHATNYFHTEFHGVELNRQLRVKIHKRCAPSRARTRGAAPRSLPPPR